MSACEVRVSCTAAPVRAGEAVELRIECATQRAPGEMPALKSGRGVWDVATMTVMDEKAAVDFVVQTLRGWLGMYGVYTFRDEMVTEVAGAFERARVMRETSGSGLRGCCGDT
jgi:hypothetical protein